jgi:hypothetical protein
MLLGNRDAEPQSTILADHRVPLPAPITVLKRDENGGPKTFFGYAKNISRSGMMIGATSPKEPGSRYVLEIPIPALDLVATCTCEVVWKREWAKQECNEPGMGLRFLDLPEEIASAIDNWLERQAIEQQLSS